MRRDDDYVATLVAMRGLSLVDVKKFNLVGRLFKWKRHLQELVARLRERVGSLENSQEILNERTAALETRFAALFEILPLATSLNFDAVSLGKRWALARRGDALLILRFDEHDVPCLGVGASASAIAKAILTGEIRRVLVKRFANAGQPVAHPVAELLKLLRAFPERAEALLTPDAPAADPMLDTGSLHARYETICELLTARPDLVDFAAAHVANAPNQVSPVPFDRPDMLPRLVPAEPKRRSALFLHNSYYHFNCLADGLRRRGWDAMTVSMESPNSPQQQFFHGQDLNLFDPVPQVMRDKVRAFFCTVPERFGALHFYGMGCASFFPDLVENAEWPIQPPFDFFELRRHGLVIGYMPSGCLDGAPQSAIRELSGNICARCVWETRPDVCSDLRSKAWAKRLEWVCDWIGIEGDWAAAPRTSDKYVRGPVVTTLDADIWRPDLVVPDDLKVTRQPGTILIYHAVGNYLTRRVGERDIKGTGAVLAAIDKLKAEGLPVELQFVTNMPSRVVRFIQVQADIVVDQLNYGRYGANARESMMLGRPVVVRLDPRQGGELPPSRSIREAPLVDATEQNVVDVLRELVQNPSRRSDLGRRSREFALAWHGGEACAERYEKVIDRVRAGLPPESPDLYPASPPT